MKNISVLTGILAIAAVACGASSSIVPPEEGGSSNTETIDGGDQDCGCTENDGGVVVVNPNDGGGNQNDGATNDGSSGDGSFDDGSTGTDGGNTTDGGACQNKCDDDWDSCRVHCVVGYRCHNNVLNCQLHCDGDHDSCRNHCDDNDDGGSGCSR